MSSRYSERDYGRDYGRFERDDYSEGRYGRDYDYEASRGTAGREGRGFTDRAGDEVRSWFGDDEAERRRRMDESYGRERPGGDFGYADAGRRLRAEERYGRESSGRYGGEGSYGGRSSYSSSLSGSSREGGFGESSILVKLGDTNFDIAGGEDVRGRRVIDQGGNDIGDVNDLIVDERQRRVRFLLVTSGGFLGLGATMMLVPVEAITGVSGRGVEISAQSTRGFGGARYSPTLMDRRSYSGEYGESSGRYVGAGRRGGRGPRGYKRSDERIREDINDRLSDDPLVDASDVEVSVSNGEVTLNGNVNIRADKRRAEDIAESVSGVTHVQNNLRVNRGDVGGTAGTTLGTAATTTAGTITEGTTTTAGARRGTAAGGTT